MKNAPRTTEFAILGLLAMGPKTGYDIKQEAEKALSHFWSESYGNIYPILGKLHERGFTTREQVKSGKGPTRIVYSITKPGLAAFKQWLEKSVERSSPKNEFLLKLFFGAYAPPQTMTRLIQDYRDSTSATYRMLQGIQKHVAATEGDDPAFEYWNLTMDCGLKCMSALIRWCDSALNKRKATGEDK